MFSRFHSLLCALSLAAAGCNASHMGMTPSGSTETGNPPVIASDAIALVVSDGQAHVRGEPGAITPPEGEVEVKVLRTAQIETGPVEDDGSFDVEVDATATDSFEVRAIHDGMRSETVYVFEEAAIAEDDVGALSCMDRSSLASQIFGGADTAADRSCSSDDDCLEYQPQGLCSDSCGPRIVSMAGAAQLDAVVDELQDGVCGSFDEDDCPFIALPCLPPQPGTPICNAGTCEWGYADPGADGPCSEPWDPGSGAEARSMFWFDPAQHVCLRRVYRGQGGNQNRHATREQCQATCPPPNSQADCESDRILTMDNCLECGPTGGCPIVHSTCAKPCANHGDCAGEEPFDEALTPICLDAPEGAHCTTDLACE